MNVGHPALAFDEAADLNRVDGDRDLLKEVAGLFMEDTPKLLTEIRTAIARADGNGLERAAHTLKSSVGNFGAPGAVEATSALEQMGRRGDFAHAASTSARLEQEMTRLFSALGAMLKEAA
jgi:HPt (histidine-containing phosphotransfer) domain-containing protein